MPGRAPEQTLLLRLVERRVAVNLERHAREARARPGRQFAKGPAWAASVIEITFFRDGALKSRFAAPILPQTHVHCGRGQAA